MTGVGVVLPLAAALEGGGGCNIVTFPGPPTTSLAPPTITTASLSSAPLPRPCGTLWLADEDDDDEIFPALVALETPPPILCFGGLLAW